VLGRVCVQRELNIHLDTHITNRGKKKACQRWGKTEIEYKQTSPEMESAAGDREHHQKAAEDRETTGKKVCTLVRFV
jgi:hypothetical protein